MQDMQMWKWRINLGNHKVISGGPKGGRGWGGIWNDRKCGQGVRGAQIQCCSGFRCYPIVMVASLTSSPELGNLVFIVYIFFLPYNISLTIFSCDLLSGHGVQPWWINGYHSYCPTVSNSDIGQSQWSNCFQALGNKEHRTLILRAGKPIRWAPHSS